MKNFLLIICTLFLFAFPAYSSDSTDCKGKEPEFAYTCFVRENLSEEATQLNLFLAKYLKAMEDHNTNELNELYADTYLNGDKLNKNTMIELIQQSWNLLSNMQYSNEIQNIRFDKNFATIEIDENITGITKTKSEITNDNGQIKSSARIVYYLQKFGKGWKIISDKTLYEETSIKYGKAKDLNINIYAPEHVLKNIDYSISLETEIPEDTFALGSITNETLTYPHKKAQEVFRQVPSELNLLERVVKANNDSLNELAIASLSFCTVKKGEVTVPEIDVTGTAVLLKRVNIE
ncbi:MAG: hypothetical protein A2Y25_05330 [Candidatus Melainabacteria bacterium GWF2_37_15]|nr:MAG: hypothetical protein A2Y25_05330 [Candidatus Melainabacteria bacterium GWF2_37_15]